MEKHFDHTHVTQCEPYQIPALKDNNFSLRRIAKQLALSASTIAREINRAHAAQRDQAEAAHALALERQDASRSALRIAAERWQAIATDLRLYLTPAQVCGRLALA